MATKRTSALFLGLALAAMGTSASAGSDEYDYEYDYKSLPGANCHAQNGDDARYFQRDYRDGSIYYAYRDHEDYEGDDHEDYGSDDHEDYEDDYKYVICSVLRDGYNRGNYDDYIKAWFWVEKGHYGKELKCTLYSASPTIEKHVVKDSDRTTKSQKDKLNFKIDPAKDYGSYYIHCKVPKGGRLYYYFWKEKGPTDYNS